MKAKRPGYPVRGSTTGRPVMVIFDVLGQRWTLRILWEMRSGPHSFRALREACDNVSPTVLNARLKTLRELEFVELSDEGYRLSEYGQQLGTQLVAFDKWAEYWANSLD